MTVWGILGFFVLSFALYAFYQSEAGSSEELQRLGTGTPVLQPNPTDPLPGSAPVSTLSPVEVPVTTPVENAPVVSDPVSETNSSK